MNAGGDCGKSRWDRICQSLLPRSLYCVPHYSGSLRWKMSDGEGGGWSNAYWSCWDGGHRIGHRESVATHPRRGGQKEGRRRPLHRTRSNRVEGRQTWRWRRTFQERRRRAPVWMLVQLEGDSGTVEQKRLWIGKERSRRGLDMRRSSIYGCGRT